MKFFAAVLFLFLAFSVPASAQCANGVCQYKPIPLKERPLVKIATAPVKEAVVVTRNTYRCVKEKQPVRKFLRRLFCLR